MTKDEILAKQQKLAAQAVLSETETLDDGSVLIGDVIVSGTVETNNPGTPEETDYLFAVKYGTDKTKTYIRYKVSDLISALAQDVVDNKNAAEEAASAAQSAASAAESDKNSVSQMKTYIEEAVSGFNTAVENATSGAISDITDAKESAVSEIEGKIHVGYRTTIGDGTTKTFTINHGLNCDWVVTQVWYPSQDKQYPYIITEKDSNTLEISFYIAPEAGTDIRVISNERVSVAELPGNFQITPSNLGSDVLLSASEISEIISNAEA